MATELDEGRRCIPISELKPLQTEWLIKVLVLRKGLKKDYKTSNGEGVIRSVIFVDEEGTKIQGTLFNEQIETWEDDFNPLQAYYIEDGKIFTPKANYISVNPDVEISFRQHTKVTECDTDFNTQNFAAGFITFVEAARMPLGTLFDVAGILLDVKVLIGEGRKTRREAVITDDRYDRKTVTLWGDLAEIEGALMASSKHENPVIAFCNIRGSIYQGEFGLSTTPVSCVLIEPDFEIADHLHNWHTAMKDCSVDIRFMPSRLMQETTEVALSDIVKPTSSSFKTQYYRFVAKLVDIINLDDLWYAACTKCYKKVIVKKSTASCEYCRKKDTDYENRYRMKIVVSAEEVENTVLTLFGGARFFVGCDVNDYIQSASEKNGKSMYYRRMEQSKGKLFSFLIKNPKSLPVEDKNKDLIVEEMHEAEKIGPAKVEAEPSATKQAPKRAVITDDTKAEEHLTVDKKLKVEKNSLLLLTKMFRPSSAATSPVAS